MSFFKNITQGFDNLGIGDSKKEEPQQGKYARSRRPRRFA